MITPIEYRIQCDRGGQCVESYNDGDYALGAFQVMPAPNAADARRRLRKVGWKRMAGRDICPDCAKAGR